MKKIEGKHNYAIIYTHNIDEVTYSQVERLLDQEFIKDSTIRIMPDCHAGAGCVIGTTMTINKKIVPNLVGVDIGCGMLTVELGRVNVELNSLDKFIIQNIPSGMNVHKNIQETDTDITQLKCWDKLDKHPYYYKSMGSLGGGNHFIEIDIDDSKNKYLIIHSGSRNLGLKIAEYYQSKAILYHQEIVSNIPKDLCYLEGELFDDYLHDMRIAQEYSSENRYKIAEAILKHLKLKLKKLSYFETIHNYINFNDMILRKGAISAYLNEKVLIPINMRDGCIIGKGLGNKEYNFSACHGAGRILSRSKAKNTISLNDFKNSMKGIFSSTISHNTIDEAPFVYKPMDEIIENIKDSVEIIKTIKPIYNFKSIE